MRRTVLAAVALTSILFAGCGTTDQPVRPARAQTCDDAIRAAKAEAVAYLSEHTQTRPIELIVKGGRLNVWVQAPNRTTVDMWMRCVQGRWIVEEAQTSGS